MSALVKSCFPPFVFLEDPAMRRLSPAMCCSRESRLRKMAEHWQGGGVMPREAWATRRICHLELSLVWIYISPKRGGKRAIWGTILSQDPSPIAEVLYKFLLDVLNVIVRLRETPLRLLQDMNGCRRPLSTNCSLRWLERDYTLSTQPPSHPLPNPTSSGVESSPQFLRLKVTGGESLPQEIDLDQLLLEGMVSL